MARQGHRNPECSVFVGNLDKRATEELLWELLLQAGPIRSIYIPCDKETGQQKTYGFVEFSSSDSAHYAWELLDGIKLFDRPLTVRPQKGGEAARIPSNQVPASSFYQDFYYKYDEFKRRPQSEPRRSRWEEENYHRRNNSFSHPLNRSMSSPAHVTFTSHQWPQMMHAMTPPRRDRTQHMGSPVANMMFFQTPPSGSNWYP